MNSASRQNEQMLRNDQGRLFRLPRGLKDRCKREHGWNDNFSDKAVNGYSQFMKLKLQMEDWDATQLSPSVVVDQVWHLHILDVQHYVDACQDYASRLIGHNPDGMLDIAARDERIKTTKISLKTLFGRNIDETVWNFPSDNDNTHHDDQDQEDTATTVSQGDQTGEEDNRPNKRSRTDEAGRVGNEDSAPFTIRVRNQTGEETFFRIKQNTKMSKLFDLYAAQKGVMVSSLVFKLDGELITQNDTPITLELDDHDQIDVLEGTDNDKPITICVRGNNGEEETLFRVGRNTRMSRIFEMYASRKGVHASSLNFRLDGERIEPNQTPRTLELDDYDQIDAIPEQTGC